MELSITVNLGDKMPLDELVAVHEKARSNGFASTDDFVTSLVAADLAKPSRRRNPSKKKGAKAA